MIFQQNFLKLLDEKALEILMELCVDIYAELCFKKNLQLHHSEKRLSGVVDFFIPRKRISGVSFFILKKGSPTGVDLEFYNFITAHVEVYNCTFSFTTAQTGINYTLKHSLYI